MGGKHMTNGEKQRILEMRESGVALKEIAQRANVSMSSVGRICKMDLAQKQAQISCRKCGVSIPIKSRFCFMCGAKILTRSEQICEDLTGITSMHALLPDTQKDRFIHALNSAIAYIKEEPTHE